MTLTDTCRGCMTVGAFIVFIIYFWFEVFRQIFSKNGKSQDNEILCKVLVHSIVVLIHEIFELNIWVNFHYIAEHHSAQKSFSYCANPLI